MKKPSLILLLLALTLPLFFTFGQVFYYKKRINSIIKSRSSFNSRLTANLGNLNQNRLILRSDTKDIVVEPTELKKWIESYTREYNGKQELRFNTKRIVAFLEKASRSINSAPVNARLIINEGKAAEFKSSKSGNKLNVPATVAHITSGLAQGSQNSSPIIVALAIDSVEPEISLDKINSLGINELLAQGESDFGGSPKHRKHNLTIGSQRFTGIILKPGEEFSFNKFLGDVDALNGYLPELVIKKGALIAEYGGGLCQVSTTLFRAATIAGLPILERHEHSLPVHYYNPQGYDATIYPGVSDLKFKNDTAAHILIQSKIVGSKLYFEIYGTKDGRQVVIKGPRQYDIRPDGSLKAELTRVVTYSNGQEKKDIFKSSYKSPGLFPTIRNPLE